jgi:hypothetical protein
MVAQYFSSFEIKHAWEFNESDGNAKGIAGSCMLVLMIVKPRDFKSPYR